MKRLFVGVLAVIMIFSSLTGNVVNAEIHHGGVLSEVGEHTKEEYSSIEYKYNDEMVYIYEYEKLIPDDTLQDILTVFSDECLELSEVQPADIVNPKDSAFPNKGCLRLVTNDDVNYMFHFDSENVLVWRFEIPGGSIPVYQGLFKYKETKLYSELTEILDDLSAQIIQKRKDDSIERAIQKNTVNISDLKIIYSGQFYAGNWLYDWGVCSYLRETETEPTTVLYRALANQEGVLKLFLISDDVKNNTVYFNNERAIEFIHDSSHGKEYDFDDMSHISQLQIKVTDDMKAEEIAVVQKRPYLNNTFITEEYVITAENMTQKGALPREMFDVSDNKDDLSDATINKESEVKKETEDNANEKEKIEEELPLRFDITVGDINTYKLREKFSFTFKADENFDGIITDEVAQIGEIVEGEVRIYIKELTSKFKHNNLFNVTTLKGSKGTIELWGGFSYELDYYPLYKPTDIIMTAIYGNRTQIAGNWKRLIRYDSGDIAPHRIMTHAEFDGDKITGMQIKYAPYEKNNYKYTMDGAVDCLTYKYELLIPLEEPTEKEKAEEQALENRNPLRYVTKVKGKLKDGTYHDYRINAVYKLPMDDLQGDMPTWYKSLGEDVNVYLLSLTQTIDKRDRRNYTLIKFQGSKDEVWFSMANAAFGKNDDSTGTIVAEYNSLISFDGYESIRNTVEYDTISITANFAADDDMSIDNLTVEVEGKKDYTSYNEMTYIGGGKITYESFV